MAKTGKMLRIFKSRMSSIQTILPNGKPVPFINGMHTTDDPYTIAYLDQMVMDNHPQIYIDTNDFEVDSGLVDPSEALKDKIIRDYLREQEVINNPNRDMGATDQTMKLNVGNSQNIAEAAAGGSGLSMSARLLSLQQASKVTLAELPKPIVLDTTAAASSVQLNAEQEAAAQQTFAGAKKAEQEKALAIQLEALKTKKPE